MLSRGDFSILQYISLNLHNFSLFLPPLVCANITEKRMDRLEMNVVVNYYDNHYLFHNSH